MSIKQSFNSFFDALKAGFAPTKAITNWKNGWSNLALLPSTTAMLVLDKGTVDVSTTSTSIASIDCVLFLQNLMSSTQQDDLLQYLDELYDFLKNNPQLGGIQEIEIRSWDISISDDGNSLGLLTLELSLTAQI